MYTHPLKNSCLLVLGTFILVTSIFAFKKSDWGFYGHRLINKMAVFTLPPEMIGFYKQHIAYIEEHSIDPDKRRYATKFEAIRHYIDIDHWDVIPFDEVPRDIGGAIIKYGSFAMIGSGMDTVFLNKTNYEGNITLSADKIPINFKSKYTDFKTFFYEKAMPHYYDEPWKVDGEVFDSVFQTAFFRNGYTDLLVIDSFSIYGILPYHLEVMQRKLTNHFKKKDVNKILRTSAEYGHYLADAHVPLHTTKNYNGALTNQEGIHAFWESRLPELFAETEYNFFTGPARYIEDPRSYFWNIIQDSHAALDSVLGIEKELSAIYPADQQYCYDERLNNTVRIQCESYARAYHERMNGMVEERMRGAIAAIGNMWYTAWVDAGQPALTDIKVEVEDAVYKYVPSGKIKGVRSHEN